MAQCIGTSLPDIPRSSQVQVPRRGGNTGLLVNGVSVRRVSGLVWVERSEDIQVRTLTTRRVWSVCAIGRGPGRRVGIGLIQGKKRHSKSYSRGPAWWGQILRASSSWECGNASENELLAGLASASGACVLTTPSLVIFSPKRPKRSFPTYAPKSSHGLLLL